MPYCAVYGCSNSTRHAKVDNIRFFRFPKEEEMIKKWVRACRRKDTFPLTHATVCSAHFSEDCFELPLKYRLLTHYSAPRNLRTIKPDAVPTINIPPKPAKRKTLEKSNPDEVFPIDVHSIKVEPESGRKLIDSCQDQQMMASSSGDITSFSADIATRDESSELTVSAEQVTNEQYEFFDLKEEGELVTLYVHPSPRLGLKKKRPKLNRTRPQIPSSLDEYPDSTTIHETSQLCQCSFNSEEELNQLKEENAKLSELTQTQASRISTLLSEIQVLRKKMPSKSESGVSSDEG